MKKMRNNEVAAQLGVTTQSVRRYVNLGLLECDYTPSGQRVFTQEQVDAFLGKSPESTPTYAYYTRSSSGNPAALEAQQAELTDKFGATEYIHSDKGSGLNTRRKGLHRLLADAKEGKFSHVAITHKDRLTRFGYEYLELLLGEYNVTLVVLHKEQDKSLHDELMQDFMSLIASFSGKYYRLRGRKQKEQLLHAAQQKLAET